MRGGFQAPALAALACLLLGLATTATAAASAAATQHAAAQLQPQPQRNSVPAARGPNPDSLLQGSLADAAPDKPPPKPLWPLDGIDIAVASIIIFSLSLAGGGASCDRGFVLCEGLLAALWVWGLQLDREAAAHGRLVDWPSGPARADTHTATYMCLPRSWHRRGRHFGARVSPAAR
jgi:hypothetical protein